MEINQTQFEQFEERMMEKFSSLEAQVESLKAQIDPIARVYGSAVGFGDVIQWLFKWLFIPASIILTIVITWKQIKKF